MGDLDIFWLIVLPITGLGHGLVTGGALAAFITILDLVPRLMQLAGTNEKVWLMEAAIVSGTISGSLLYFFEIFFGWGVVAVVIIGTGMGIVVGLTAAALAEVLNVIPVFTRRLGLKPYTKFFVVALVLGKMVGSLYYWLCSAAVEYSINRLLA